MDGDSTHAGSKDLRRLGGAASLAVVACYIVEFFTFFGAPADMTEWFGLFSRSRFLGLFYINALDIFSISLLPLTFLALYDLLKGKSRGWMTASTSFALLGAVVFVATRAILTGGTMVLSQRWAAAGEAERAVLINAGTAIQSLGQATPQTVGFFFMALGVIASSAVALKGGSPLGRVTAVLGLCAGVFNLADDAFIILAPRLSAVALAVSGVFWLAWWIAVGVRLLAPGRRADPH